MMYLLILAALAPWLLGGSLLIIGIIFYPFHEEMLDVVAWVASQF